MEMTNFPMPVEGTGRLLFTDRTMTLTTIRMMAPTIMTIFLENIKSATSGRAKGVREAAEEAQSAFGDDLRQEFFLFFQFVINAHDETISNCEWFV